LRQTASAAAPDRRCRVFKNWRIAPAFMSRAWGPRFKRAAKFHRGFARFAIKSL
jgi:hypothetical protein